MHGSMNMLSQLVTALSSENFGAVRVGICPPAVYLSLARSLLANADIQLGAQNASEHESGALTGEISASMLRELGCRYVLVGHSERRQLFGETDTVIAAKFEAIIRAGMEPVLCVGETQEERDQQQTAAVVFEQIDAVRNRLGDQAFAGAIIAYEPVWAIGTGKTATPEQAQEVHQMIRQHVAEFDSGQAEILPLLYGGSMKAANAAELLTMPDVDGGLVGGASLNSGEFIAICRAAESAGAR